VDITESWRSIQKIHQLSSGRAYKFALHGPCCKWNCQDFEVSLQM